MNAMPPRDQSAPHVRARPSEPQKLSYQLLVVNLDREPVEFLRQHLSPCPNIFFTRSPQKAMLWNRLEALDLILMRFGEPVEQSLDLLQSLIEANPAPPILLLTEPGAERVADHLVHRGICLMQPISISPAALIELVQPLLNFHSPGARPLARVEPPFRETPAARPAPAVMPGPPADLADDERSAAPRWAETPFRAAVETAPRPALSMDAAEWEFPFLEQLVIELAHRLKNPLVSIKTFTHLLRERFSDAKFRERFYAIVGNDVVQLNETIDRLLEFTEFTRPYPKPLRLDEELKAAAQAVEAALSAKRLTLQIDMPPGPGLPAQLQADPMQFRYLLGQLLLDAAAAATPGGRVRLSIAADTVGEQREPALSLRLETAAGPEATARPHEWPSLELLLAKNLVERQRGALTVGTHRAMVGGDRRQVTAVIPLAAMAPRHDRPAHDGAAAIYVDRRRIPLAITFRERRQDARRRQNAPIPFRDRRRASGGGTHSLA